MTGILESLAGCTTARMKLAPELTSVAPMAVSGWDRQSEVTSFANWQVNGPGRHGFPGRSVGSIGTLVKPNATLAVNRERAGLRFEVASSPNRESTSADCRAEGRFGSLTEQRGRVTDETEVSFAGFPRLACQFSGSHAGWLTLSADFSQRDAGTADFGPSQWLVRSVNNLEGQGGSLPLARFGYEFRRGARVVAAVEVSGPGRVWMNDGLSAQERGELAVGIAAVMYYAALLEAQDSESY